MGKLDIHQDFIIIMELAEVAVQVLMVATMSLQMEVVPAEEQAEQELVTAGLTELQVKAIKVEMVEVVQTFTAQVAAVQEQQE
jgi:hypothetical protein